MLLDEKCLFWFFLNEIKKCTICIALVTEQFSFHRYKKWSLSLHLKMTDTILKSTFIAHCRLENFQNFQCHLRNVTIDDQFFKFCSKCFKSYRSLIFDEFLAKFVKLSHPLFSPITYDRVKPFKVNSGKGEKCTEHNPVGCTIGQKKKRNTSVYFITNYRVPIIMVQCLLQLDDLKFFLEVSVHGVSLPNFNIFNVNPPNFE